MGCDASNILRTLQEAAAETREADALGRRVVAALHAALPQASWIGIYWLAGDALVLGPYIGHETEHVRIPVGQGVCGTAVEKEEDQLVEDVRRVKNYLACAPDVRSELVVLIRSRGEIVGQFDLDARDVGAFSLDDHCVLRAVADGLGGLMEPPVPASPDSA